MKCSLNNKIYFSDYHHQKFLRLQRLHLQQSREEIQERVRADLHDLQEGGGRQCAACLHLRLRRSSVNSFILILIR